jgi:hypothetical protein
LVDRFAVTAKKDRQRHGAQQQTRSHGSVAERQPSPFSDAFTAARRVILDGGRKAVNVCGDRRAVNISSQCSSPRASSTGEGLP